MNAGSSQKAACIGGGNIGRAWAIRFAVGGFDVALYDPQPGVGDQSMAKIAAALDDLAAYGLISAPQAPLTRIRPVTSIEEALDGAVYAQECAPEDLSVKQELFADIAAVVGDATIVGSSTSEFPGSSFMRDLAGNERFLVVHPTNPPYLVPFVEICPTPWTSPAAVEATRALMEQIGQAPIVMTREVKGFVLNRLQYALVGEALHLVGEGVCSASDIDKAVKYGLGLRWAFMGPFQTGHLNASAGYQAYMTMYGATVRSLTSDMRVDYPWDADLIARIHAECEQTAPASEVPRWQRWRDQRLMGLARHFRDAPEAPEAVEP